MKVLNKLIIEWAKDKGILENGEPIAQCDKTYEEVGELYDAILLEDKEEIINRVGKR